MKPLFAPSLMCMDFMNPKEQLRIMNQRADFYHIDIMDGHFVPNITLSPTIMQAFQQEMKQPMDAHLMVTHPADYFKTCQQAGATYLTPHAECMFKDAFRLLGQIKELGCKAGVAICPATPLEAIESYAHLLDKITIMTVDPGFAGQPFIDEMLEKIVKAKRWKQERGYRYLIEVDGACNSSTFQKLTRAGNEVFVVGSSGLFGLHSDLDTAWDAMLAQYQEAINV